MVFIRKAGKWMKRHKIITIITAIIIAAAITLPCVYVKYYTTPKEFKEDRLSEGIVPTAEDVKSAIKYDRVVIFGVDGAGGYFGECDTPNFDRIFSEGNVNYNGVSEYPTVSAQNWGSMFFGVTPQTHQINNTFATTIPHAGVKYPSFFKTYSKRHKDATFYSVVDWSPINYGLVENGIRGMTKKYVKLDVKDKDDEINVDRLVAENAIERLEKYRDTITFMHFDCVDHAGHASGYGSDYFTECIQTVDEYIGRVYDAYAQKDLVDGTLFICVTDHGHSLTGGHGGESETEKLVMLAVAGNKGNIVKGTCGKFVSHDLASVVLYALGEEQPSHYEGGVPKNLFTTLE